MFNQLTFTLTAVLIFVTLNISTIHGASPVVSTFAYNVTVKTASTKFDDHNGKLKLSIIYMNGTKSKQDDFVLTPDDINIDMNRNYSTVIACFAPLGNITSVYLRWTLASPYNPIYAIKKPSIYFDSVTFTYSYFDVFTHSVTRKFCPPTSPVAIKHADGASFYPCI